MPHSSFIPPFSHFPSFFGWNPNFWEFSENFTHLAKLSRSFTFFQLWLINRPPPVTSSLLFFVRSVHLLPVIQPGCVFQLISLSSSACWLLCCLCSKLMANLHQVSHIMHAYVIFHELVG